MIDQFPRRRALRALAALALGSAAPTAFARSRSPQIQDALTTDAAGLRIDTRASAREQALALVGQAPHAPLPTLVLATEALARARAGSRLSGADPRVLAVIDFSLPSTDKRFWIFDTQNHALLFEEWVAHGRNSGDNYAQRFSNEPDSHMSSLGAYEVGEAYQGKNGHSLRLHGLEPGFNDLAYDRAIVIHGASYVSEEMIESQGRLGRSFGCPAVRQTVAQPLIDTLAERAFLFCFYPQRDWLARSALIGGHARPAGAGLSAPRLPTRTAQETR